MGAAISGCCEADDPTREENNMQKRYRSNSYSMTSGDESEAPPDEIDSYRGRTMSEMEYVAGFKRSVIAGNSGLAIYFAKEYNELNLLHMQFDDSGQTCVHVAVAKGHHGLVADLLKNGASVKC